MMMRAFSSFQIQYLRFHGIAEFQIHRIFLEVIAEHVRRSFEQMCPPAIDGMDLKRVSSSSGIK